MPAKSVIIAASTSAGDSIARWWNPIRAAWPRFCPAPEPKSVRLDELLAAVAGPQPERIADGSPILLGVGPEISPTSLYQLVDRLQQLVVPAIVLFPVVDQAARALQGGGVLVESWDANPIFLAAALAALGERQSTVRGLLQDLAISSRYSGGVSGEIDRIHEELNLAAAVQQELLPRRLPRAPGFECGVLFRPAGYVSGDIYDVVDLGSGLVAFFIADAVGHGVPAALMTMVISKSLRMTRPGDGIVTPGEAMTRLNDELCRGVAGSPRFSTAVYGLLNTRTREVRLAGAGHPPPLRIQGNTLARVETDGPLLGVFPGEKYSETSFTLDPGETLLLYSDGFETAFEPPHETGGRRGTESYLGEIANLDWPDPTRPSTIAAALRALEVRIDQAAGSLHQADDVTAVALCCREAEPALVAA
ncbi:MAG: PP2C family protein-serine/threonine phosphatase [Phycisphaerales bacterium]